jgi:hypothetical protein
MCEDNKGRVREFFDRVLTAGEIDATGDYFHPDVVEEVPFPGQGPGLGGSKRHRLEFAVPFRIRMDRGTNG